MTEVPQNLHRDIMRSVKVVKKRYYLFGVLSGFIVGLLFMSWIIFEEMTERGSFGFLAVFIDSLKVDLSLITEFGDEIHEFIPFNHLGIWLIILLILCLLSLIIFRFRKALFLKVDKFKNGKK